MSFKKQKKKLKKKKRNCFVVGWVELFHLILISLGEKKKIWDFISVNEGGSFLFCGWTAPLVQTPREVLFLSFNP